KKFARSGGTQGFQPKSQLTRSLQFDGSSVGVTVRTRGSVSGLEQTLQALGGKVVATSGSYGVADAYLPVASLHTLVARADVAVVKPIFRPILNTAGIAPNQADPSENIDMMRSAFGLTGAGMKVGVISDSVNQASPG